MIITTNHQSPVFLSNRYFKLLLLLITLLWLILKSPVTFTTLVNESNPSEIYYFYLEFFIWALISIPLFYFIFSKRDLITFIDHNRFLILIFVNFFYALFRTFKTLDVTDTGFHFTKAWGLLHGSASQNIDFFLGTSFINGLWLSIIGSPNILWARLGYVFVVTGITIISFKIFSIYFKNLKDWCLFSVFSLFFIHFNYYLSVNYDNLPVLSALGGIWLLLKPGKIKISYVLSGMLLSLTIWIKFNFILILILPAVYGWILYEQNKTWVIEILLVYTGYAIFLFAGAVILMGTGYFNTYTDYISKNFINRAVDSSAYAAKLENLMENSNLSGYGENETSEDTFFFLTDSQKNTSERKMPAYSIEADSYNLKKLFNIYFGGLWTILKNGTVYLFLMAVSLLLLSRSTTKKKYPVLVVIAFILYYVTYQGVDGTDFVVLSSLIFPAYIFLIFYLRYNPELIEPTVLILLVCLFSFPGSVISFNVIYRSGAGLLMLSFPLAFMINKQVKIDKLTFNLNNYVIIFLIVIALGIIKPWGYLNSHRDSQNRSLLVEMFTSPQLFGIHTFPQRAKAVDEALEFFRNEQYEKNNTPALFLSWIPMMYYLTETNCLANNPWHGCVGFKEFKKEFDSYSKNTSLKYITLSKVMTRNPDWPLLDKEYRKKDKAWIRDLIKFDYIRYWMKDKSYTKVFENEMFEVYKNDQAV